MKPSPKKKCCATFSSVHHVLQAEKVLQDAGITLDSIPVPREISSDCGICLSFSCEDGERVEKALKARGLSCERMVEVAGK
jgi:hypothetical protein